MNVTSGTIVRIDCELRVSGGEVIESSKKTGPVEYRHGQGQLPPGLEKQLEGMKVGEEKSGLIPAAEAFGTTDTQPQMRISRSQFPPDIKIEVGARFAAKSPQGTGGATPVTLEVTSMETDAAVAKVVHPLAGKDVEYTVKVLGVRPPPPPVPSKPPPQPESVPDLELTEAD